MWKGPAIGGVLPAQGLSETMCVESRDHKRWLLLEYPRGRSTDLLARGAVDKAAAAVEWRAVETPSGLELGPLGRQEDLVDQHSLGWQMDS